MNTMKHENTLTVSLYIWEVNCLCYDKETRTTEEKTMNFCNEKLPSDAILMKELSEASGLKVIDILDKKLSEKTGLYRIPHREIAIYGERIGDVREKKAKA